MDSEFVATIKSNVTLADALKGITLSDGELQITISDIQKK